MTDTTDLITAAEEAFEVMEAAKGDAADAEIEPAEKLTDPGEVSPTELANLPADYVEPWSRLEEENDRAWELFRYFRELGIGRTIADTAAHFEISVGYLHNKFTARFDWRMRVAAWDRHCDRVYRLDLQDQVREMAKRHANQIVGSLEALSIPFMALRKKMEDPDFIDTLSDMDFRRVFDLAVKSGRILPSLMSAERLARGMPTEIVQTEGEIQHVHTLDGVDQLAGVLSVLDRAGAFDDTRRTLGVSEVIEAEAIEVDDDISDGEPGESEPEAARVSVTE